MLAALFYAPLNVRLEERPLPLPGPGEALLQVAAATMCGTDLKTFRRGHPVLFQRTPAGFGHEVARQVAAVEAQRKLILAETEERRGIDVAIEAVGTPETRELGQFWCALAAR